MRRLILTAVTIALTTASTAAAQSHGCGHFSYRFEGSTLGSNVYILSGRISCAKARSTMYAIEVKGRFSAWKCSFDDKRLIVTCRKGSVRLRTTDYSPATSKGGPGDCQDVHWGVFHESATSIVARDLGCHEAQSVALQDMQTPACVGDCIVNAGPSNVDTFECAPSGDPYGAYQDEECDTYDGGPKVTFTIVNGP